jgi:hypothetical protein
MAYELSPQSEQYIASVVSGGLFSSKEAALEAAVAALREKTRPVARMRSPRLAHPEQAADFQKEVALEN